MINTVTIASSFLYHVLNFFLNLSFSAPFKPTVTTSNETLVPQNKELMLHCTVISSPKSNISWFSEKGERVAFCEKATQCVYKLDTITVDGGGRYHCKATNLAGNASSSTMVQVGGKCIFFSFTWFFI